MKAKRYRIIMAGAAAAVLLSSCVKDDLYNTPHPDRGAVAVTLDGLSAGESADGCSVEVGEQTFEYEEGRFVTSDPLPPGEYTLLAHNNPAGFSIAGGIARVLPLTQTKSDNDIELIQPRPDCLWSGTQRISVMQDDTLHLSLDMERRMRDLHIELTVTEGDPSRIVSATGTLTGIAGAFDMHGETLTGEATATAADFAHEGDKVSADLRILGTMGAAQTFTLVLTFVDGYVQTVESDLTTVLSTFNGGDYGQAFTVTGNLGAPVEAGVGGCTITDWTIVYGDPVEAM